MQIKNLFIGTLILFTFSARAQMLKVVKSTIQNHLSENKKLTDYVGDVNIINTISNSENKTITVNGTYLASGTFSGIEKPFVAILRILHDDLIVEKLCYYRYLTAIDQWQLKCTNGAVDITPLPEKRKYF